MNEKGCILLKKVVNKVYSDIDLDSVSYGEDVFYYEFKSSDHISENDFEKLEKEIKKIDNKINILFVKFY